MNIHISYFNTAFGNLMLGSFNNKLCLCDWRYRKLRSTVDNRIQKSLNANYIYKKDELINETEKQLTEYFNQKRKIFDIPILFVGTEFQKQIWNLLLQIGYGKTDTYLGLSMKMKKPKAIRAIASANGANAISIIVPCHRILGSDGKMVGYAGGIEIKKKLLSFENANIDNNQLKLF